ncbi:MAG: glycosyltransferase family 4 protein [Nitrososphaeria archaeon]
MRILWINHRDPKHPMAGGAERHLVEVGKRLVKKGHEITLITERFAGSEKEEIIEGIRIKRFGGKFILHLYSPYFVKKNANKFEVIIDDIAHAVPFWSPKFTKKPVAAIVHHVHQEVVGSELPPILRYVIKKAEKSIRWTYENIIAVSKTTKRDLMEKLSVDGSKINVIYNGIDHIKYKPGKKFDEPTILWIGRMKKYKNVDHLIEAFELVKRAIKDVKLVLAGRGEEECKIKSLVHEKNLNDVIFAGYVSEDSKIRLLQGAWCVVYTSKIEGWGMGILEAAACKTTAIAYNSGALKEVIINGETGLLVKYGDIKNLAYTLMKILENKNLRDELSKNALNYSYNFDWGKTTEQTEKYLESII